MTNPAGIDILTRMIDALDGRSGAMDDVMPSPSGWNRPAGSWTQRNAGERKRWLHRCAGVRAARAVASCC
jgi:hypothetical protein